MNHRSATFSLLFILLACSSGGSDPRTPEAGENDPAGAETGAPAESGPPADETPEQRTIRLAKEKRQQCDTIADTIQAEPEVDIIANINDAPTLKKLAVGLEGAAKILEDLDVTVKPLLALRDKYVGLLKGRAQALRDAAATKQDAQQKEALKSYQDHTSQVGGVIDEINQFCSSEALE
ncbi:MAG: hypothetical protein JRI68_28800 [Deltaproteobacteria bacterium]|nr:hypothetical protein [Deltaproteobacteria bacterium]